MRADKAARAGEQNLFHPELLFIRIDPACKDLAASPGRLKDCGNLLAPLQDSSRSLSGQQLLEHGPYGYASTRGMKILVTGVSAGIGRALAERMIAHGHTVWGIARDASALASLENRWGERFHWSALDVTDPDAVRDAVGTMHQKGFLPDAVVLNAGIYPHDCEGAFRFDVAERVFSTNVAGALFFVDQFLPLFLKRMSGRFVAISSVLALRPDPLGASYAASKAALTMAFRSFALRYRRSGVHFTAVLLGPVATEASRGEERKMPVSSSHIPTPDRAAVVIERALHTRRILIYYPWLVGMIFRLLGWLPDTVFDALTRPFRR